MKKLILLLLPLLAIACSPKSPYNWSDPNATPSEKQANGKKARVSSKDIFFVDGKPYVQIGDMAYPIYEMKEANETP